MTNPIHRILRDVVAVYRRPAPESERHRRPAPLTADDVIVALALLSLAVAVGILAAP